MCPRHVRAGRPRSTTIHQVMGPRAVIVALSRLSTYIRIQLTCDHRAPLTTRGTAEAEEGLVKDLTWLLDRVKRAQRQLETVALRVGRPHDLRHRLHQLSVDEKAILRRYIIGNTRTQELDPSNSAVAALARDRILTTVTQVRPVSDQWAYTVQPWVWTYLNERPELLADQIRPERMG
jgi:hypothetical protein